MRIILTVLFIFTAWQLSAQRDCTTNDYIEQQKREHKTFATNLDGIESFIQQRVAATSSTVSRTTSSSIIRIPVVVHILYNATAQNISDAQIRSQLEALNRDFRKRNSDTVNTPDRFKAFAADVEIEFVLATADPKGKSTTGILRKSTTIAAWTMDDKIKFSAQGGSDAWDTKNFLNIWVGNLRQLLGYSSAPGAPADKDGIVINTSAFGTINTSAPYNMGRTTVHEVGHWLGLKHI